ncbi:MAG: hypothetical protein WCX46_02055 [Candidatus Paceibacterota bacterium]
MVLLQFVAGLIVLITHIILAHLLYKQKAEEIEMKQNFTTWMLAGVIDSFLAFLSIKNGNEFSTLMEASSTFLPLFYAIGSFITAGVLLYKKIYSWTWWDTIITVIVLICIFIWIEAGDYTAIIVGIIASTISFIPQIRDTNEKPHETPFIFYFFFLLGDSLCFIGEFVGGNEFTVKGSLFSFTEILLSLIIIFLVLFIKFKKIKN